MAKYCTNCGKELDDEASFCSKCGTKIVDVEKTPIAKYKKIKNENIIYKRKPKIKKTFLFAFIVFVLIVIILLSILLKQPKVDDFCADKEGIWVDKTTCSRYGSSPDDICYTFVAFEDGYLYSGTVPGSISRTGEVVKVKQRNNTYTVTLYYSEGNYFEEYYPEEYVDVKIIFEDDYFFFKDSPEIQYSYMGYDFETAQSMVGQYCMELLKEGIPKISSSSTVLDGDFEALKIRMGYDLHGPNDSWRSNSEGVFYLTNLEEVDCYLNISTKDEMLGVKEGEIVFFGVYGLTRSYAKVKDFLPDDALYIEPAVFYIQDNNSELKSYVWELDNGYMSLIVIPLGNMNFYDESVTSVVYVTDLSYLAYVK